MRIIVIWCLLCSMSAYRSGGVDRWDRIAQYDLSSFVFSTHVDYFKKYYSKEFDDILQALPLLGVSPDADARRREQLSAALVGMEPDTFKAIVQAMQRQGAKLVFEDTEVSLAIDAASAQGRKLKELMDAWFLDWIENNELRHHRLIETGRIQVADMEYYLREDVVRQGVSD